MPSDYALILREPLTVTVAGQQVTLPYQPAAVWAAGLERGRMLIPYLARPAERDALAELVLSYPQAVDDLKRETLRILTEAGGRKWWEVVSLLKTSVATEVLGRLVLAGADPWQRSLGEWTSAVYALCVKGLDEKGRLRFDFSLSIPPADFTDEWDDGDDPEAALAAVAAMTGKK